MTSTMSRLKSNYKIIMTMRADLGMMLNKNSGSVSWKGGLSRTFLLLIGAVHKQTTRKKMENKVIHSTVLSTREAFLKALSVICDPVKEMLPFACGQKTTQHNEGGTPHEQPEPGKHHP